MTNGDGEDLMLSGRCGWNAEIRLTFDVYCWENLSRRVIQNLSRFRFDTYVIDLSFESKILLDAYNGTAHHTTSEHQCTAQ